MKLIRSHEFKPDKAWAALEIANMNGITTRLHWTDKAYDWHTNDGEEVFVVLSGNVDMHYIKGDNEHCMRLNPGDIFYAGVHSRHAAHPIGEARILVIEQQGSV